MEVAIINQIRDGMVPFAGIGQLLETMADDVRRTRVVLRPLMPRRAWRDEIEPWFVRNGLPYFVPAERERVRPHCARKAAPLVVVALLVAVAAAVVLTMKPSRTSSAPATITLVAVIAAARTP